VLDSDPPPPTAELSTIIARRGATATSPTRVISYTAEAAGSFVSHDAAGADPRLRISGIRGEKLSQYGWHRCHIHEQMPLPETCPTASHPTPVRLTAPSTTPS